MAYAADRLYNEVIRREMGVLATKVKVRDIVAYLPCLTITDREEIEAKREIAGNYSAMMALLENLRRRENWPEQFITALHHIEQPQLANLISDGYNNIRGIHTASTPAPVPAPPAAAPPTPAPTPSAEPSVTAHAAPFLPSTPDPSLKEALATVTTPTVQNIPCSTLPLQTPLVQIPTQSSTTSPMNSAPSSHPNKVASDSAEGHAGVSAQDAPPHTPPKATQPVKPVIVTGPPSPVSAPTLTPSVGQSEVLVDARETPTLAISDSLTHAALSGPSTLGPTVPTNPTSYKVNKPVNTSQSSQRSALPQKVLVAASISVKHPVQDTNPPGTGLQNNTTINQVGERVHTREPSQTLPSTYSGAVAGSSSNIATEYEENLSKPGVLREEEPLSNISDPSLQISNMTADSSPCRSAMINRSEESVNGHVSVNHNLLSSSSTTVSDHVGAVQNSTSHAFENSFQEGGNSSYSHQPVEDDYESLQISRHVIQFSENPSLPNLDGQPSSVVGPTIDLSYRSAAESPVQSVSEAQSILKISENMQRNNTSAQTNLARSCTAQDPFRQTELNTLNQVDIPQSAPREESQGVLHQVQSNSHLIAAVAIGMAAVFVALKFKH